jgi:hypothetical protein
MGPAVDSLISSALFGHIEGKTLVAARSWGKLLSSGHVGHI